ncbi:hypothetical protein V8E36_004486 [Tilletia maclaganii]
MASASVYYKFRSQKDFARITFDGTGISVWDLKREIILQNKMGRGQDFDLKLFNADTGQEYTDDNTIVPRSSQVTAQRAPPSRPNEGTAQKYVAAHFAGLAGAAGLGDNGPGSRFSHNANASGVAAPSGSGPGTAGGGSAAMNEAKRTGMMSRRFDGKGPVAPSAPVGPDPSSIDAPTGDEASSIAAMFAAGNAEWDQAQQGMSTATYIGRGGMTRRGGRGFHGGGRGGGFSSERRPPGGSSHAGGSHGHGAHKPPGPGYICYRCGQKGHWIQDCPTNDDREFDNRPRLKRTTGIPKSMLKTVEQPPEGALLSGGVMITPDGSYVIAQADTAAWKENQARSKPLSENDVYAQVPSDSSLACPLCAKLLRNAVKTPCCATLYCEECIQTHLLEHDFQCAECERRIADLADLKRDEETIKKVRAYVEDAMTRHERGQKGGEQGQGSTEGAKGTTDIKQEKGGDEGNVTSTTTDKSATSAAEQPVTTGSEVSGGKREGALTGSDSKVGTPTRKPTPLPPPGKHALPPKPAGGPPLDHPGSGTDTPPRGPPRSVHGEPPHSSPDPNIPPSHPHQQKGFVNPALLLPQMMMMLQNPHLPGPVRMQVQMNVQMIQSQIIAAASGAGGGGGGQGPRQPGWNGMGMGMGGGMGMGMGMNMGMGMGMGMQQQQQQGGMGRNMFNFQGPQMGGHGPNWNGQQDQFGRQFMGHANSNNSIGGGALANGQMNNTRKRDRGQAELVEVGGAGEFGASSPTSINNAGPNAKAGGGQEDAGEGAEPASKVARTS